MPQVVDLGEEHAVHLAAGTYHTCALLNTSTVKCWGANFNGQLGIGSQEGIGDDAHEMGVNLTIVPLPNNVRHVSAGAYHNCALLRDGAVYCWGWNEHGQSLPFGSFTNYDCQGGSECYPNIGDEPGEVGRWRVWDPSSCSLKGQLGCHTTVSATEVVCADLFSCARLQNDDIHCWGLGAVNQDDNYQTLNR